MISVLPDNKTILVTCEVASPQAECLVTINCTKCLDGLYNSTFFRQSLQLTITPGDSEYYVVTVQAIRTDNNDILEEHAVTETIRIPEAKKPSDDSSVQGVYINNTAHVSVSKLQWIATVKMTTFYCT